MRALVGAAPTTPGWTWRKTHWDNWDLTGPESEMRKYRGPAYVESLDGTPPFSFGTYTELCWWCGSRSINPTEV